MWVLGRAAQVGDFIGWDNGHDAPFREMMVEPGHGRCSRALSRSPVYSL
jgi:hypothetical protein